MDNVIQAEGLVKQYGETTALEGVDLTVRRGSVLGLLGPNGAGKTTVVRILATLAEATAGRAWIDGFDVAREGSCVRRIIGLTGQYASVDEKLTGRENLLLIGRLLGLTRAEARQRAQSLLAEFSLEGAAHRAVQTYSGGMRRRLDLAASLVGRPRILFLDEPTTGLDPRARLDLWDLVRRLVQEGTTVLLTTQYLEEADALADNVALMDQGRVIAAGTPDELKSRVGGQVLVVQPERPADLPRVVELGEALTGGRAEVKAQQITIPSAQPEVLPVLMRRLDEARIPVRELMLRGASLEEVFLALTGRPVPEEPVAPSAAAGGAP